METMGAVPYDYSGLTEVGAYGFQCQHQEQAIHVNEGEFIIEIIDPETEKPLPEGEIGEMVLTNLGRLCSPSIRFRVKDLVRFKRGTCPCGRTFRMLDGGVLGRSDEMIIIRGLNIFPSQVGEVVQRHLVIGEEYQIVAHTKDGLGEIKVLLELAEGRDTEAVTRALKEDLRQCFEIRIESEVVPQGTLLRSEYKSKRFIDKRQEI
jgi:phenylacetate-CoA ligase